MLELNDDFSSRKFVKLMKELGYNIDLDTAEREGNLYIMYSLATKLNNITKRIENLESK